MKKYASFVVVAVFAGVLFGIGNAAAWNFTVPAQEVRPDNGTFVFPASVFADGKAKHYEYKASPDKRIRFFVVKSTDGIIRAAFDTCEVCYKAKKGYVQKGNDMVCINCGLKFRTDKVNEIKGGCNPSPLKRTIQGDKIVINQGDVMTGLHYFQ
ncbi:MAG TPA: DUF2318 domain-containing protein [Desulfomonilaceae bacterium]|nr:DUF2318 domain-containing protein [Desulfomonilaceae bacterium]